MTTTSERYGFGVDTDLDPEEAETRIREALAEEGFGILTEIDVSATLYAKLGIDWPPYRILGACNPQLAHQALSQEADIGLLLPCNVIVARRGDTTAVRILEPSLMVQLANAPGLTEIAAEARRRLSRALASLPTRGAG